MGKALVYCSGPMFDPGDKYDQQQVNDALEKAGYDTYLPQRDGIEIGAMMNMLKKPIIEATFFTKAVTAIQRAGFSMDVYQVVEATDALVLNLNGRVPDEGSVMETATAYAIGKPIVVYKDTPITAQGNFDNPMIQGLSSTWENVGSYDAIAPALDARIAAVKAEGYTFTPSKSLQAVIEYGRKVQAMTGDIKKLVADVEQAVQHEDVTKLPGILQDLEKLLGEL